MSYELYNIAERPTHLQKGQKGQTQLFVADSLLTDCFHDNARLLRLTMIAVA